MDFTPDQGQQAVADVVTSVLTRDNSWDTLVSGGVTALAVPERFGGDGVGLPEMATALTEIGRHGTSSPVLTTVGPGLMALLDWLPTSRRTACWPEPGSSLVRVESRHDARRGSSRPHQGGVAYASSSASGVGQINDVADFDTVMLDFLNRWPTDTKFVRGFARHPAAGVKALPQPPASHTPAGTRVSHA